MGGFSGTASSDVELARTSVSATNPLDTNENILATINIPVLLPNSQITVYALLSKTGTQLATYRIRLGGIGGTAHLSAAQTTTLSLQSGHIISNRGAINSQVSQAYSASFGTTATAPVTGAIDTSVTTTLVITTQQSAASVSASEVVKLERYRVIVNY